VTYGRDDVIFTFLAVLELVYEGEIIVREDLKTDELLLILKENV
jgi:chromatin segregation and condensation protein Rec8/ScpA/Scc1 (kleisin family)